MKAELLKREGNQVTFKITVDNDKFESAITKAYNKNKGKFNIPGFRKGKAPKQIIESQYGKGVFYNDAIDMLFPEVYPTALDELNIDPINRPDLDIEEISKDNGLVMVINVEVKPEVKLGEYKGIEISKPAYTVNEEEAGLRLEEMRNRAARLVDVEDRAIEAGDTAIIDFEGFQDGVAFEGGKGENYSLVIGSNTFIPGFEDQLVGKNKGEEVEVNVEFPAEYHAENLAGKPAVFKCTVHEIKVKELPELDDDFAQDVSKFDTLEEYKEDVKAKLAANKADAAKRAKEDAVIEKIIENAQMDIPEAMIDTQARQLVDEFAQRIQSQGLSFEQYLQFTGMNLDTALEQMKPNAVKRIQSRLVLEAVVKAENLEVSDDDVKAEIAKMAETYKMDAEKLAEIMSEEEKKQIQMDMAIEKAVELVTEAAKEV